MEKDKKELNQEEMEKVAGGGGLVIKEPRHRLLAYRSLRADQKAIVRQGLCPRCGDKPLAWHDVSRVYYCGKCKLHISPMGMEEEEYARRRERD